MDIFPSRKDPSKLTAYLRPPEAMVIAEAFAERNWSRAADQFPELGYDALAVERLDPRKECSYLPALPPSDLQYVERALYDYAQNTSEVSIALGGDKSDSYMVEMAQWRRDAGEVALELREEFIGARLAYESGLYQQLGACLEIAAMEQGYFERGDWPERPALEQ